MIIGFLGKGGSGKSTLSSAVATFLSQKKQVLALDADHNMDLTYNLGAASDGPYIGQALDEVLGVCGVVGDYRQAFYGDPVPRFSLAPVDALTEKYSVRVHERLAVMTCGPHTDAILHDRSCSHILTTPLKVYLPLLHLTEDTMVVVDEKAGADGVGTGVTTGFNLAVVVSDPSPHGTKAANQIMSLLDFFGTPYVVALNKVMAEEDMEQATSLLAKAPEFFFPFSATVLKGETDAATEAELGRLEAFLADFARTNPDDRLSRTVAKYKKNQGFLTS